MTFHPMASLPWSDCDETLFKKNLPMSARILVCAFKMLLWVSSTLGIDRSLQNQRENRITKRDTCNIHGQVCDDRLIYSDEVLLGMRLAARQTPLFGHMPGPVILSLATSPWALFKNKFEGPFSPAQFQSEFWPNGIKNAWSSSFCC